MSPVGLAASNVTSHGLPGIVLRAPHDPTIGEHRAVDPVADHVDHANPYDREPMSGQSVGAAVELAKRSFVPAIDRVRARGNRRWRNSS